jgi:hypothetical protein
MEQVATTGKTRILTNRAKLSSAIGVPREKTISKALKALETCGLINYRRRAKQSPDGNYSGAYLEIFMCKRAKSAPTVLRFLLGGRAKNAPTVDTPSCAKGQKTPLHLLRDSGAVPSATATVPTPLPHRVCSNPIGEALSRKRGAI